MGMGRGRGNHLIRRMKWLQGHRRRRTAVARSSEEIGRRRWRSAARPRDSAKRDEGRGLLSGVCRSGAIPRGYWAHPGRKPPQSGLPKAHVGLRGKEFRVGCRPGETTGNPAGNWASKLGLGAGGPSLDGFMECTARHNQWPLS